MTAGKRTREAAYDRTGYANVADKFVTCVQREGSFSITAEDCRNLLALISERDALREALRNVEHQLSTDSDLDDLVTRPDKYDALLVSVRAALAIADGADGRCKECGEHLDDGHGPHCDTGGNL